MAREFEVGSASRLSDGLSALDDAAEALLRGRLKAARHVRGVLGHRSAVIVLRGAFGGRHNILAPLRGPRENSDDSFFPARGPDSNCRSGSCSLIRVGRRAFAKRGG